MNIGVGRAAGVLNEMVESTINLQVPAIKIVAPAELQKEIGVEDKSLAAVNLGFRGTFSGTAALVSPTDSASKLVSVLTGDVDDPTDLDSVRAGTLTEVGNIVLNEVMGSMANVLEERLEYSVPTYLEETLINLLSTNATLEASILVAETGFVIEELQLHGDVLLCLELGSFDALLKAINRTIADDYA
jgi:chemotaxis protein CheC